MNDDENLQAVRFAGLGREDGETIDSNAVRCAGKKVSNNNSNAK